MKDISDLLDIIEKDEARKLFSDTFYPNHDFNLMDMIKNFDKDFEKFWSENFNTDVADRPALVEALKKRSKE